MTGPVLNEGNKLCRFAFCTTQCAVHYIAQQTYEINIFPLIVATNIVSLSHPAFVKDHINCPCMVFHEKPIAYIFSFPVNGDRLAVFYIIDGERDHLFREME